jgi:hypothetical protein
MFEVNPDYLYVFESKFSFNILKVLNYAKPNIKRVCLA